MVDQPPIIVIDGDTVQVGEERARIAGCDAPELHRPRCPAERRLSIIAAWRLQQLADSGDLTWAHAGKRDKYGRMLGTLRWKGTDVCEILIGEGLAVPYDGRGPRPDWCGVTR